MSINCISNTPQISFSSSKNTEIKKEAKTEQKYDKKKLALALAGLATIGLVTIGIAAKIKKGKAANLTPDSNTLNKTNENIQKKAQELGKKLQEESNEAFTLADNPKISQNTTILDKFNSQQAQSELDSAIQAFKKTGHFDDNFNVAKLEDLTQDLTQDLTTLEEKPLNKNLTYICGTMSNGKKRTISLQGSKIRRISDFDDKQNGYMITTFDKNGKVSAIKSNGDTGYDYNKYISVCATDGKVKEFALANPEGEWICNELSYDSSNPIKLF